jgi:DNA repair protein RecN (Recombination protein N)
MLRELRIKNLAIIDDITIDFGKGLNTLTGETGAGKSILITALCLALGERASGELIRSGEQDAVVEVFFDITRKQLSTAVHRLFEDMGIDVQDGVILKRIITAQGKNRAYVNGSMVNVQTLSDVSNGIIDVHGQYEHQSLLSTGTQLDMIDTYGGLLKERREFAKAYETYTGLKRQKDELEEKERDRAQRLDMLTYQISEIEAAGLRTGDEEELEREAGILKNSAHLSELANRAYESLYSTDSACLSNLSGIIESLREIARIDTRAGEALKNAEEALPLLEEASYFLRDYREGIDFNPERLEAIQEKIELIKGLKRKYGGSVQEVLDHRERAVLERDELVHADEKRGSLMKQLEDIQGVLTEKAARLSKKRKTVAKKIEQTVIETLSQLAMPDTKFEISLTQEKGDITSNGLKADMSGADRVEYRISPNIGEDLKPLSKIASGGELSRVMLALKATVAQSDKTPVLIFDEIDAGIGGVAAESVGKRLKGLASHHQTICVTHLPQIASYADTHLKIDKAVKGKRTTVTVKRVERYERAEEIARMLSGDGSEVSIKHAKEMLKKNAKIDSKK